MIAFTKAHGYGNDFLYVLRSSLDSVDPAALAREMCDRHSGVGADGLIVYAPTPEGAEMRLWNADGSRSEVSGNGVRALAALLARDNPAASLTLVVDTEAGKKRLQRTGLDGPRQIFRAAMGLPTNLAQTRLEAGGESVDLVVLSIGNPQALVLGPLPDDERFARLGAALERHPFFPDRTNVEFVEVVTPTDIRIRIWERGVGPTTSSGTGSCASLVAAATFGGATRVADVAAPGGTQRVEWREDSVYLTGWAEVVCDGRWLREPPR